MQDYKIRIDGSDGKTCRVTIDGPAGVNETWENVPRALESFLAVLNGTATNDAKDPLVQEGELLYYNYGKHVR
ncbi:MAG: hypothetical protein GWN58_41325, partial [Anaerolineae bacterium]|nr:hypothetical protein [Anaerolineae bacterium]